MVPNQRKSKMRIANRPKRKQSQVVPKSSLKKTVGKLIHSGATTLGGYLGGPLGATAGGTAASLFNRITGLGMYKVRGNSLLDTSTGVPIVGRKNLEGAVEMQHNEVINTAVMGTTAFTITEYNLNPGLETLLPYMSRMAANFEYFRFKGLIFYFRSSSAVAVSSTNTALGNVYMATEYNNLLPAPTSAVYMENMRYCVSGPPSHDLMHPVECSPDQLARVNFAIRTGSLPVGGNINDYDLGKFYIATEGMQASSVIGQLWVCADVEFRNPILTPLAYYVQIGASVPTNANLLTGSTYTTLGNDANSTSVSGKTITFRRPGIYLVTLSIYATISVTNAATTGTATIASVSGDLDQYAGNGTGYYIKRVIVTAAANQTAIFNETLAGTGVLTNTLIARLS